MILGVIREPSARRTLRVACSACADHLLEWRPAAFPMGANARWSTISTKSARRQRCLWRDDRSTRSARRPRLAKGHSGHRPQEPVGTGLLPRGPCTKGPQGHRTQAPWPHHARKILCTTFYHRSQATGHGPQGRRAADSRCHENSATAARPLAHSARTPLGNQATRSLGHIVSDHYKHDMR